MTSPTSSAYAPLTVTPDVFAQLQADGYVLPSVWPEPAFAALDMSSAGGWTVGSDDDGNKVYTSPDGVQFTRAPHGHTPHVVGLSKKSSPVPLNLLPGAERPSWLPTRQAARKLVRQTAGARVLASGKTAINDEQLRAAMTALLTSAGDMGKTNILRLLRSEYAVSQPRSNAMYDQLKAEGVAKPVAIVERVANTPKQASAKVKAAKVTKAAPKPSAKKAARKVTKKAASSRKKS